MSRHQFRSFIMSYLRSLIKVPEIVLAFKNSFRGEELSYATKKFDLPVPPKRPPTAYMLFCKEYRPAVLKENSMLTCPEVIKKLAAMWNGLSVQKKEPYEVSAREFTQRYGEEHKKYFEGLSESQKKELSQQKEMQQESRRLRRLRKALKESGLPKAPLNAYNIFACSQTKTQQSMKPTDFFKEISEKWKNISEEDRKPFRDEALARKLQYESDLEKWKQKLLADGKENLLRDFNEMKRKG